MLGAGAAMVFDFFTYVLLQQAWTTGKKTGPSCLPNLVFHIYPAFLVLLPSLFHRLASVSRLGRAEADIRGIMSLVAQRAPYVCHGSEALDLVRVLQTRLRERKPCCICADAPVQQKVLHRAPA